MQVNKALMLVVSLMMLACISTVAAQDQKENDGLARVYVITPKDGQAKALEKAITGYHHYMADKKGAMRYQWYSITTGSDTGKYVARTGSHNWEDFDASHDWEDEAQAKFASDVQPYIAGVAVSITRTDDELGIWPDSMEGYQYFSLTDWYIQPGQAKIFNEGLKKIDTALKEADWPSYYAFVRTVSGGRGNQMTLVIARKSFADMAPKEPSFMDVMNKALGEEEAAGLMAEWGSSYKVGKNRLVKYRPKLSDYGDGK